MNTYEAYLDHTHGNTLPVEEALQLYSDMVSSFEKWSLEDKDELWEDFLKDSTEYAHTRAKWEFMTKEEKAEADPGRTTRHNSCIDHLNIFARNIEKEGIDCSWRKKLGDDRKRIGDFICFVTYITAISNR